MLAGHEHQDAKRQRYAMPDVAATAHALMALNAVNNQVAMWGSLNQLPSLQHFLAQGRPETSTASLENAPHGPAGQSTSSTPSPGMQALKPMYSPKDLAQALASLSQAQQHQHPHAHKCAESRDAVEASQGRHDAFPGQSASSSKDSSDGSSPSTPPSRPAQPERAPPTDTSANVSQTNAARVVKEGVQKDGSQGSAAGGAWQGGSTAAPQQGPGAEDGSAHNKYCHFCQHIKVKRASSMIACENRGCNRRFCEHCLNTHVADPSYSLQWRARGLPWHCPICTKTCCCTLRECSKQHRHCKAFRYRRKRAQLAETDLPQKPEGLVVDAAGQTQCIPQSMLFHASGYPGGLLGMMRPRGPHLSPVLPHPGAHGLPANLAPHIFF